MTHYFATRQPISQLLKTSLLHFPRAFKASVWFILLIVLIDNATVMLRFMPSSPMLALLYVLGLGLITLYLWSCALYAIHSQLQQLPVPLFSVLGRVASHLVSITLFMAFYLGFFALMLFWMGFLNHRVFGIQASPSALWWLDIVLVGMPLLLFLLLFSLTIPLILVNDLPVHRAMLGSAKMVWLSHLKSALVLYGGMILFFYLTTPSTGHMLWLYQHHIKPLFDLVVYLTLGPLLLTYALVIVQDLNIMLQDRERRLS